MARISGNGGSVLATATVAGLRRWEITYHQDEKESPVFGDNGIVTYIMGAKRWFGTFEGYKDGAPLALSDTTAITATFKESATTGQQWSGSIFINDINEVVESGEIVTIRYGFVGNGTLTIATA